MSSMYPGTIPTFTAVAGTTLFTGVDHAAKHNSEGSAITAIATTLGTTSGTSVLKNFSAGQFPVRTNVGGTIVQTLIGGTVNNTVLGTPSITGGTITSSVITSPTLGTPTLQNPVLSGTLAGGTIPTTTIIKTPSARVYSGTQCVINTGTATTLTFDTERYDTDTMHGTANPSRLTATTAGIYMIGAHVGFDNNATGERILYLVYNGTANIAVSLIDAVNGDSTIMSLTTAYELVANDYMEVKVTQNSGGTLAVFASAPNSPEFWMTRIAPASSVA